ncbi:hypothetical protein Q3G72_015215 [Acer saccharum]|nr:hypothetical protein Q3G72_015215 [Acer saccharum]
MKVVSLLPLLFSLLLFVIPLVLTAQDKKTESIEDAKRQCGWPCCGRNYHGPCKSCCFPAEIPVDSMPANKKPAQKSDSVEDAKYSCGWPCCGRYYQGPCGICCSPASIPIDQKR